MTNLFLNRKCPFCCH